MKAVIYFHHAFDPYWNMAVDEWLLERALMRPGALYFRLYSWQPGGLTFGVNQRKETALDFSKLNGTPAIRRITGGRALYHDPSELTYAIAANTEAQECSSLSGTLASSSAAIARVLVDFLAGAGIASDFQRQSAPENQRPLFFHRAPCFASHARHEISGQTGKIIASAQRRMGSAFLQHGAIKIDGVSAHPALSMPDSNFLLNRKIEPINGERFERFGQIFREALERGFGLETAEARLMTEEKHELAIRVQKLRKKSFERREIY